MKRKRRRIIECFETSAVLGSGSRHEPTETTEQAVFFLIIAKTISHVDASVDTTTMRPTLPTSMGLNVTSTTGKQGMLKLITLVRKRLRLIRDPSRAHLSTVFE